jgi:transcriptional regulator with XRE-family HTH domain
VSDEQRSADETAREYAEELRRWRERRGLSKRGLALLMSYDRSYVSQIEGCHLPPTEDFTRRAEAVLTAGDSLWARWEEYEAAKRKVGLGGGRVRAGAPLSAVAPLGGELFAEHDDAALTYDGQRYHLKMSRHLHNEGEAAVTRYLMRVSVDRYPGEPERSNQHYRRNPLTIQELDLAAWCGDEPMAWEVKLDRDALKEIWLLFQNRDTKFPLYPGQDCWIHYSYVVSDQKWGPWFQRAVRLPTRRLSVRLSFPTRLQPVVWGTETSPMVGQMPLRRPLQCAEVGEQTVVDWTTERPPLNARYRFEWKYRASARSAG